MMVVVGDIHGNIEKARAFLAYRPDAPHIALGDYLDSFTVQFEQQVECLNLLMDSGAVLLFGNHDLHYLRKPLFHFAGYQLDHASELQDLLEYNLYRFKAAHAVDGWLLTHAGLSTSIDIQCDDVYQIAATLNFEFEKYLQNRLTDHRSNFLYNSIFQFNYRIFVDGNLLREDIRQIFGHVEFSQPVIEASYIALDSTNSDSCWIFDTTENRLVQLPLDKNSQRQQ